MPVRLLLQPVVLVLLLVSAGACARAEAPQQEAPQQAERGARAEITLTPQESGTDALLIGVSAASGHVVWVGGTGGTVLRTTDGGRTWQSAAVPAADTLQFRDVHAVNADTAYLLSIGPGAASRIYKTTDAGRTWERQFTSGEPEAFFDCMAFWDEASGLAFSDAVAGQFIVITTRGGGATWQHVPAEHLPPARPGGGSFAASGTCVAARGDSAAWIGTGNARRPRVLRTTDRGRTWEAAPAPIDAGEGAGIASIVFRDARHGLALGGDIGQPAATDSSAARTDDGGRTWRLVEAPPLGGPVYGAAYVPGTRGVVAVGPGGVAFSPDEGASWRRVDTLATWGAAFADPQAGWLVGPEGRIARVAVGSD